MPDAFEDIYRRALSSFADADELEQQLPVPESAKALRLMSDDRYLSTMCLRVFRAGLKHSMVDARWPQFEQVFKRFKPPAVAAMGDEALEAAMSQPGIIRHWGKIKSIRTNACMVQEISQLNGGFGNWLAAWPGEDIVGLWQQLKHRGAQLGGNSGPAFLRMVGKDTFLLSPDVVAVLLRQGVVSRKPSSKQALAAVQAAFNDWQQQSGRPLCQISRILSYTA
jgi:3-methyladenine DNA glycosylase Tag